MPSDWARHIRPSILDRDGHMCTMVDDGVPCVMVAREVDHIGDRDDHRPENLRAVCEWHHARRSSAQGNAARRRPAERRQRETHPGLRT